MELRRLRYFVTVAEESSFNRAAQKLHMAQPPLSNQIKQLEKELGVLLFERTNRGVRTTEAGELLLEEAQRILLQMDQAFSAVRRVGRGTGGENWEAVLKVLARGQLVVVLSPAAAEKAAGEEPFAHVLYLLGVSLVL